MPSGGAAVLASASAAASAVAAVEVAVDAVVAEAEAEATPVAWRRLGGRNRGEAGRARQQASRAVAATESPRPGRALRRWRQLAAVKWRR